VREKNITHQQKKLNEEELRNFRSRFNVPISDDQVGSAPFYKPPEDSEEIRYILERRKALGGFLPERRITIPKLQPPDSKIFQEYYSAPRTPETGSSKAENSRASTTMVAVRMLSRLLKETSVDKYIVPIIPDEARTFGMEPLFRQVGIYSHSGQKYEPVDKDTLLYYREEKWGQILEEGITEAGSISSFIAAGTAYATHGIPTIPWFMYYSMFGFQRIGDLIWAAGDMQARGFLFGSTAGRTTLAGEGLQHQDGHSHLSAYPFPHVMAYDPAYAYELAVIIEDGLRLMCSGENNHIRYITVYNESYPHPTPGRPIEEIREGILRGIYRFASIEAANPEGDARVQLFGSGALLGEVEEAAKILAGDYGISSDIWSVTSYKQLFTDALKFERDALLGKTPGHEPYLVQALRDSRGPVIAITDYVKALPLSLARWIKSPFHVLGTDGFGRSDSRSSLRDFFEVDRRYIAPFAIKALVEGKKIGENFLTRARLELKIKPNKKDPALC
jgi:pyruvate dehydrogenase E1 component